MIKRIGLRRFLLTLLLLGLALAFVLAGWSLPLVQDGERAHYDVRQFIAAPRKEQDQRIVMVVFTEATLARTERRSPLDRKLLAAALRNLDALGPKAIGIDILIDQPLPGEDEILIETFRTMRTPVHLGFATATYTAGLVEPWQEAQMRQVFEMARPGPVTPASVRIEAESDNVVRTWPYQPASLPPILSLAMLGDAVRFADYRNAIQFLQPRIEDRPVFAEYSIELFENPEAAAFLRPMIEGRYVLLGANLPTDDQHNITATRVTRASIPGLEIHAHMMAQALDNARLPKVPWPAIWLFAALVVGLGAMTAWYNLSAMVLAPAVIVQLAVFGAIGPTVLQMAGFDTQGFPVLGAVGGWLIAYLAVGAAARSLGAEQRRFAQTALGKYLPPTVAKQILQNPEQLSLRGERRQIVALFTDLEGFTRFCHDKQPETIATILNAYLDSVSDIVLKHGGTLDKFVGDAVVAFWGAPIARDDDADRAIKAAVEIATGDHGRKLAGDPKMPRLGKTRVGLHYGEALVGNFGGEGRMQYTALGDSMNTASRLESSGKSLKTTILVSSDVLDRATVQFCRPMGRIIVRGRATPIEVWEPAPDMAEADIDRLKQLYRNFEAGDLTALESLSQIADARPADASLHAWTARLRQVGPGGSYALD
jgi:adenylate cyclase